MHEVRPYIIQETLVVRDDYDRIICSAKFVYTTGDNAQSVDIKTRISLIEDCQFWLQHCHLENFIALFLTPGKTFVQTAAEVAFVHLQKGGFLAHLASISRASMGSSPRPLRLSLMAVLMKLLTLTPGISTGYWKLKKIPLCARSSGSKSRRSSPSKSILPPVTS